MNAAARHVTVGTVRMTLQDENNKRLLYCAYFRQAVKSRNLALQSRSSQSTEINEP